MSTRLSYSITCDRCNRQQFSQGDETEEDAQDGARHLGWGRKRVENGSTWDFCPRCFDLEPITPAT